MIKPPTRAARLARRLAGWAPTCLLVGLVGSLGVAPLQASYVKRYSAIANGAVVFTGNSLGLDKVSNQNNPGTSGSIGAFGTLNTALKVNTYPSGTTLTWTTNSASAQLSIPAGSTVLYAELIWGGSYNYGGQNVSASLNNAVKLTTPGGAYSVSPSSATAATLSGNNYYVRSADVTTYVQSGGAGTYTVGGVPATVGASENNANAAGWTLAVAYSNPSLPARNLTIFVGAELTSTAQSTLSSVSGFCTPASGTITARLLVSAIEGDASITGDQMTFGPTTGTMVAVSGPNNPANNFFAGQINGPTGALDTSGTFGTRNHTPGSPVSGARQGWDITSVDVSSAMVSGQTAAYARGTTTGDRYTICALGLQINVGSPTFPLAVESVDKTNTFVGDVLTYTVRLDNTAGSADALNVTFSDTIPYGTQFVAGSVKTNGVVCAGADILSGFNLGTVAVGRVVNVSFQLRVTQLPLPPAVASFTDAARWSYSYASCAGFPLNTAAVVVSVPVVSLVPRLTPAKSANPSGRALPGARVTYTITIPNDGTTNTIGTTLADPIPTGTTYVPNSTKVNGVTAADVGGTMPFVNAALINSPGQTGGRINVGASAVVSFDVTIDANPPLIISNIATVDPDGSGPAPSQQAIVTNPPVTSDLGVGIANNQVTNVAGLPATYVISVTNNGPDTVIGFSLSVVLPSELQSPAYTASAGTYSATNSSWSGLTFPAGGVVTLTVSGLLAPGASGTITATATVASAPGVNDTNPSNNSASDSTLLMQVADLGITKDDSRTKVSPGDLIAYVIAVTNAGPSAITSLTLTDPIPAALTNVAYTPNQGLFNEENGVWTGLSLTPGQVVYLVVAANVLTNASGTITNTVTVTPAAPATDPVAGNNSATDLDTIAPAADLKVGKTGPAQVNAATNFAYAITVTNTGPSAASNVVVFDTLPVGASLVSAPGGGTLSNNVVYWRPASSLASGGVLSYTLTVQAPAGGTLTNTAAAASDAADPVPGDNGGTNSAAMVITTVTPQADVAVAKSGPAAAYAGTNFTYTLTVTNSGPSSASNVVVFDPLPANVAFLSASASGSVSNSVVYWPAIATLTNGESRLYTLSVTAPAGGAVTNTAASSSPTADPVPTNNGGANSAATAITAITPLADVQAGKTGPAAVNAGTNFTYTLTLTNAGPSTASNVVVFDTLPAGATFVSASDSGFLSNNIVYWPALAALTNGANLTRALTVQAPATGPLTNRVASTSDTLDPAPGNNDGTGAGAIVITALSPVADVQTLKSGPAGVSAATNLAYTITVTNAGPSVASNVVVFDTLPTGASFVSASGSGTLSNNVVYWPAIAALSNAASSNYTLTLLAPASGALTNRAASTSSTADPLPANNNGSSAAATVVTVVMLQADVQTTKAGPSTASPGANFAYTILVTNAGPSAASNVVVRDTLPIGLTFVSASGSGALSNNVVTWPTLSVLATGATTNYTLIVLAAAPGVYTNSVASTSDTYDPSPANNDGISAQAKVATTVAGFALSGYVYQDLNRNSTKDSGETGTGLTLFAKLLWAIAPAGPAIRAAPVDPSSGAYSFADVSVGVYIILIDNNDLLADVSPSLPAGWSGTEVPNQTRNNVVLSTGSLSGLNFGLSLSAALTGVVFKDTGTGGGTANDGAQNGGEAGLAGVVVRLADASGATVYDTATTDASGLFTLRVPASVTAGTSLSVLETTPSGYISTGGRSGTTGGAYNRSTDAISFTLGAGLSYAALAFGDVPDNEFNTDGRQTALAGSTVVFPHSFIAGTAGQVSFATSSAPSPAFAGWNHALYRDSNGNGQLDPGEPLIGGPLTVAAGDRLQLLLKEFVPLGAPFNAQDQVTIVATFTFVNASPALSATYTHTDLTVCGDPGNAGLTLSKTVDKATALPGETLTYTITYANRSSEALGTVVLYDATPVFTTFLSATQGTLPPALTSVTVTAPPPGTAGNVRWTFSGVLLSGASGTVSYCVVVDQP